MKTLKTLFLSALALSASAAFAEAGPTYAGAAQTFLQSGIASVTITGQAAQAVWDQLQVQEKPGLGFEGLSNSSKTGTGVQC
jgi:hypothetical protein